MNKIMYYWPCKLISLIVTLYIYINNSKLDSYDYQLLGNCTDFYCFALSFYNTTHLAQYLGNYESYKVKEEFKLFTFVYSLETKNGYSFINFKFSMTTNDISVIVKS